MNLKIGNKISEFRRESGKTQEQLADYVGVSVAAVSKWETNQSYPDITLLPSIADFFEVSIDSLIGYTIADNGKKLEEIQNSVFEAVMNGDYNKALPIIFDALKKYPNDFILLDSAAHMLQAKAWTSETKDQDFKDVIGYLERAIKCAGKENSGRVLWLKKGIAQTYDFMGDTDKAIEKLEEINESGRFNFEIALMKYKKGDIKDAVREMQSCLWNSVFETYPIICKLADYYKDNGNLEMAIAERQFCIQILAPLTNDTPNYVDIWLASEYESLAENYLNLKKYDGMWQNLEKAVYHAVRFDKNPCYKANKITFLEELSDGYQMSSSNNSLACHGVLIQLKKNFSEFSEDERYIRFCNELESAKRTKAEAGVWTE